MHKIYSKIITVWVHPISWEFLFQGLYMFSTFNWNIPFFQFWVIRKSVIIQIFDTSKEVSTWLKAMAPHSSTLAWKIPWTEEPVRLQSMGSLRVGYDWATSLSLFTFMHWRRKWQPTPVFLPGESQGRGEPGRLPSMGSQRVRHDWSDLA